MKYTKYNGKNELVTWYKFNTKSVLLCERSMRIACDKRRQKLDENAWNEFLLRFILYIPIYAAKKQIFFYLCSPSH